MGAKYIYLCMQLSVSQAFDGNVSILTSLKSCCHLLAFAILFGE